MRESVSLRDIAQEAGVSPSTVSRALHHHPRISEETAQRIRRLAKEMGYTPSLPARSLVTRDTATVGLVITHVTDPFVGRLVLGVEEAARATGYSVFLASTYRDADRERDVVRSLYERRATGIVVTGSAIDNGYLELQQRFPLPVVLINCQSFPYSVSADNLAGAREAVELLVDLGHRCIAYIANPQSQQTNLDRLQGYKEAMTAHNIPLDDALIVAGDGTLEGGSRAMERLLEQAPCPTAVFCFNDLTAMGAIHALGLTHLRVPDDCSVIGYDDLELSAYAHPPLTTVRQPSYDLGQRAMGMLLKLIQGRADVQAEILPTRLVVRHTTGPAPTTAECRKEGG
jgi:DNA-binding LacI/PurR family transcriptional regulator